MHSEDSERQQRIESEARLARGALAAMLFALPFLFVIAKTVFGTWSVGDALVAIAYFIGATWWWWWHWHTR